VSLGNQDGHLVPAGVEPGLDQLPLDFTGGVQTSEEFKQSTNFVYLQADAACHVLFALSPTATTSNAPLAANSGRFFGVRKGITGLKVSVIAAA
jgi:hypothetical protein